MGTSTLVNQYIAKVVRFPDMFDASSCEATSTAQRTNDNTKFIEELQRRVNYFAVIII